MSELFHSDFTFATTDRGGPPPPPVRLALGVEKSTMKDAVRLLFTPDVSTGIIRAVEGKRFTSQTFQSLAAARIHANDQGKIAHASGAKEFVKDNLTLQLLPSQIPAAYHPYLDSYPIQLAMTTCSNVESFEKFVHILTASLANAENTLRSSLPEFDREGDETYPSIAKRIKADEPGYERHVGIKCRMLDVFSRRYQLCEVEGETSVLSQLKTAAGVDQTQSRPAGRELRRHVTPQKPRRMSSPVRKPSAPAFALVPLQERAFGGSDKFIGIHPYLERVDTRGSLRKVFAVVLPTGVGKTITSAELMARVYQRSIDQLVENQTGPGLDEALVEKPPALLFVAPQREIAIQSARAYHGFLTDQYEVQTISSIITGGKRRQTKWAEIQKVVEPYKNRVQEQFETGALVVPPAGPLAGQTQEEIKDLLLTHWEDVMQLSQSKTYWDFNSPGQVRGEIVTEHEAIIRDLRIISIKSGIIDLQKTQDAFRHGVTKSFERLKEGIARKTTKDLKEWQTIENKYREAQKIDEPSDLDTNGDGTVSASQNRFTPAFIQNRITARWDDILSPFNIDDREIRVLREIVSTLKIPIPAMFRDLVTLTLECQAGMIRKPDPKDYSFNHLDAIQSHVRRKHPFVAAFSTIQALYDENRLQEVITDLSANGTRKVWVIFDEAHHIGSMAKANGQVFYNVLGNPLVDTVIGMTASDVRADGQQITEYFERTVAKATLLEAVESGRLQKFTLVQPSADEHGLTLPQVQELTSKSAEKSKERLIASVDDLVTRIGDIQSVRKGAKLITDIFPGLSDEDQNLWNDGLTEYWSPQILGFCNDIPSATFVTQLLNERGVKSAAIFGHTPAEERRSILQRYRQGELNSLILVGVGREGLDLPQTTVGILFGSVGSPVTLQQMFGRFLRRRKGPPTIILDYSVPKSQEYHAELLRNQFAVDVILGGPPKDERTGTDSPMAQDRVKKGTKPIDLLSTISVSPNAIKFADQKVFAASHIQLVAVEALPEVIVHLPEMAVPPIGKEVSENLPTPEVENTQPYADVTVTTHPPDSDSLAFLLNKKVKIEVDINEAREEGQQRRWGKATIRHTDEGAEISFTLYPPDEIDSISPIEMQKRLQKILEAKSETYELVKQWELIFSGNERKGRGSIDIPGTTSVSGEKQEISLQMEGKEIKILARRNIEHFDELYSNIDIAAECLISALIPEQRSIKLEVNLAAKVKELLEDKRFTIELDRQKIAGDMIRFLTNTPWRYTYSKKARDVGETDAHVLGLSREAEFEAECTDHKGKFLLRIDSELFHVQQIVDESSYWGKKSFRVNAYSSVIDVDNFTRESFLEEVSPKLRILGISDFSIGRIYQNSQPKSTYTYINLPILINPTEQHRRLFPGIFPKSVTKPIELGISVYQPRNKEDTARIVITIRDDQPDFTRTSYSSDEQRNFLDECLAIVEIAGSFFIRQGEQLHLTFDKSRIDDGTYGRPEDYQL